MARWFGIAVVLFWGAMMTSLFMHDIWPHWAAGEPPLQMPPEKATKEESRYQSSISSKLGRIGTSWVRFYNRDGNPLVHTQTLLDGLPFKLPPLLVDSELTYTEDKTLDSLRIQVHGSPIRLELLGENYGMDFSCELITGPGPDDRLGFKLDADAAAMMSDAFRPFTLLKGLYVGKTWRIRLINPLPVLQGGKAEFESCLVRVTRRETIQHQGKAVECYKIESRNLRAWANDQGNVLVQEVDLPIFGTLTIRQEPFNDLERLAVVSSHRFGTSTQRAATTRRAARRPRK